MVSMRNRFSLSQLVCVVCCALVILSVLPINRVEAALLANRSVKISNSTPGAQAQYLFNFSVPAASNLGSIEFEFCDNNPLVGQPCTPPTGFSLSSAVLSAQTGETGFVIDGTSTVNRLVLSRAPGVSSAVPVSYTIDNVTNPSVIKTAYVRLSTFASSDATGPRTDSGGVAFSMANSFLVQSYVPPYLTFCVGVTISSNCSTTTGDYLNFGELSSKQTKFLSSQFAVATNDFTGYSATVAGITMTSGNNTIPALGSPTVSKAGVSQFGMNLRANSSPSVGSEPTGFGTAVIAPDFAQTNQFAFKNAVVVSSAMTTDFNVFTVSYIVNVAADQHPGVYSTTLTYIATASF